jgi:hypothetical protein
MAADPYALTPPKGIIEAKYFTFIFSLFVFVSEPVHITVYRPGPVHVFFRNLFKLVFGFRYTITKNMSHLTDLQVWTNMNLKSE